MSYAKRTWVTGEQITATKLNNMEDGISNSNNAKYSNDNLLSDTVAGCESVTGWTTNNVLVATDQSNSFEGVYALKVTLNGSSTGYIYRDILPLLDTNKYYLFSCYQKNNNLTSGMKLRAFCSGDAGLISSNFITSTSYTRQGIILKPSDFDSASAVNLQLYCEGLTTQFGYVDAIDVREITASDYNAGVTATLTKYPYSRQSGIDTFEDVVSLHTTAKGGELGVKVKGQSLVNDVINYDFGDGTTGWTHTGSSFTVSNKVATFLANSTNDRVYTTSFLPAQNDFWFFYSKINSTSNNIKMVITDNTNFTYTLDTHSGSGAYEELYKKQEFTTTVASPINFEPIRDSRTSSWDNVLIDGNAGVFAINMTALGIESYTEEQMLDIVRSSVFEGLDSTLPVRVKSVGKNIADTFKIAELAIRLATSTYFSKTVVDGRNVLACIGNSSYNNKTVDYGKFEKNTQYTISVYARNNGTQGGLLYALYSDGSFDAFGGTSSFSSSWVKYSATTDASKTIIGLRLAYNSTGTNYYDLDSLQIEQGTTATLFEEYQESKAFSHGTSRSLPNGVKDEEDLNSGVKVVKTAEHTLQGSDITALTIGVNTDYVRISKPTDYVGYNNITGGKSFLTSFAVTDDYTTTADDITKIGRMTSQGNNTLLLYTVAKGTYTDTADAQSSLSGEKLIYQLATPTTEYYQPQALTSFENGTFYKEPIAPHFAYNDIGFTVDYTVDYVDEIHKVDIETGKFERINVDDVIVDGVQYTLEAGDIDSISTGSNLQRIIIGQDAFMNIKTQTSSKNYETIVQGLTAETSSSNFDTAGFAEHWFTDASNLAILKPLGTYASLSEAQADLAGTRILYKSTSQTNTLGVVGGSIGDYYYLEYKYANESTGGQLAYSYPINAKGQVESNSKMIRQIDEHVGFIENVAKENRNNIDNILNNTAKYGASSAGSDAYVITTSNALASYVTGMDVYLKADVSNTGASTLNVDGLGVKSIKVVTSSGKVDTKTGDIIANGFYQLIYDGTDFILTIPNAILQSIGTAQGDIIYASGANTFTRLAKGTAYQSLRMNSGATIPEWGVTTASGEFTDSSTTIPATSFQNISIPVGISANHGTIVIEGTGTGFSGYGVIAHFTTSSTQTRAFGVQGTSSIGIYLMPYSFQVPVNTGTGIVIQPNNVYISGTNIIVRLENIDSVTRTVDLKCTWEVFV